MCPITGICFCMHSGAQALSYILHLEERFVACIYIGGVIILGILTWYVYMYKQWI